MNKNSVLQSAKHVGISPEKYLTICWILSTYIVSFPLRLFMGLKAQHVFIQLRTWRRTRALGILWAQTLSFISWTWKSSSKSIFYLPQSITKLHSKALDQSEIMKLQSLFFHNHKCENEVSPAKPVVHCSICLFVWGWRMSKKQQQNLSIIVP